MSPKKSDILFSFTGVVRRAPGTQDENSKLKLIKPLEKDIFIRESINNKTVYFL